MVTHIVPLILIQSNTVVGMKWASQKTAQKTLENSVLWEVHSETHKEIESTPTIPITKVIEKKGWFEAWVSPTEDYSSLSLSLSPTTTRSQESSPLAQDSHSIPQENALLSQLEQIIIQRKHEKPEGSYTTHLFNKGKEKIRKKVGEEAVEVILSHSTEDTISESADLLYHLLVMLVNEGITFQEILIELRKRHTE